MAEARAEVAALDAVAGQLPNSALLRRPTLRQEAQSTSALEGTYAPLVEVLGADENTPQPTDELREIINYVAVAEHAIAWIGEGRPLALPLVEDLQGRLVRGTKAEVLGAGHVRTTQVVIGASPAARISDARFVPAPPGADLVTRTRACIDWTRVRRAAIDPVVAAAMLHYQFETLHPFTDGNGRIGRLLVVLHLQQLAILREPTLTVSPWFEARRPEYYDRLRAVSTSGDWNGWVAFFAAGVATAADATRRQLGELLSTQDALRNRVSEAGLRAQTAMRLIDFTLGQPIFTARQAERYLGVSYGRANALVAQLVDAGILRQYAPGSYDRRFCAPDVLAVLLARR